MEYRLHAESPGKDITGIVRAQGHLFKRIYRSPAANGMFRRIKDPVNAPEEKV